MEIKEKVNSSNIFEKSNINIPKKDDKNYMA